MTSRGSIGLHPEKCTSCMICVRECPVWCISLDASRDHDPTAGHRGKSKFVLEKFEIDYGLCMDCGICVDVCPTDALEWNPLSVAPTRRVDALTEGIPSLGARTQPPTGM